MNINNQKNRSNSIDIILATYNRKNKISNAIDSIVKQTYQNWKLYIINDGGEDISNIVKKFNDSRIKLFNIEHVGKAEAVNYGLKISKNPYISYIDDDDIVFPNHLETLIKSAITQHKQFVYSDTYLTRIDEISKKIISQEIENDQDINYEKLRYQNYINHKQILHSRELYEKIGDYDKRLSILIDWDYIKRLAKVEEPYHIKIITGNHFLYYKNGKINSISGLWTKNPEKVGESLNIIFSKDNLAMIEMFKKYNSHSNKLDQNKTLVLENQNLQKELNIIKNSKFFKLWSIYTGIKNKFLKLISK